jgi:uncharacterized protein (TIGR02271 family)
MRRKNIDDKSPQKIEVLEERLDVDKKVVETGSVVVTKKLNEDSENVRMPLDHEEASVRRVTVNRYIDDHPGTRYENNTLIVPVVKEVMVVEKKLLLVEEIHITKDIIHTLHEEEVILRKEEVDVKRKS